MKIISFTTKGYASDLVLRIRIFEITELNNLYQMVLICDWIKTVLESE